MSTLKKIAWFLLFIGTLTIICIYTNNGQIIKIQNFVSLGLIKFGIAVLSAGLLMVDIFRKGQKELTKRQIQWRQARLATCGVILFCLIALNSVQSPVVPVSIELNGIAKTSDVLQTQKDVHGVNKITVGVKEDVSDFRKEQEKSNKEFSKNFFDLKNQASDYNVDNQTRQQAIIGYVKSVDTALVVFQKEQRNQNASFSKGFIDLNKKVDDFNNNNRLWQQNVDKGFRNVSGEINKLSIEFKKVLEKKDKLNSKSENQTPGKENTLTYIILFSIAVLSVVSTRFWKNERPLSLNMRSRYIPGVLVLIMIGLYFYPKVIENYFNSTTETKVATKDSITKKDPPAEVKKPTPPVVPVVTDTTATVTIPEEEKQDTVLVTKDEKPEVKEKVGSKKRWRSYKPPQDSKKRWRSYKPPPKNY